MASKEGRFRFEDYELDLPTLELRKADESVPLSLPLQPSRALGLLVENAGSLVTREQLHRHLWPDSVVEVDQGLNTCIRRLRSALGDAADAPVYIETVPRRGYRFIAPVHGPLSEDVPPAADATLRKRLREGSWPLAVGLVVAAIGVVTWLAPGATAPPAPIRLVVLPFQAIGTDERGQFFADGLSEELITTLAGLDPERLAVVARTSAAKFAGGTQTVAEIGSVLHVDFLLEGSIRPAEEGYRLAARLIEVASESTVWSDQRDRAVDEPISAQEWLASRVSSAVIPTLMEQTVAAHGRREPVAQVRLSWLMARHLLNHQDPSEAERSVPLLREVLDADPTFAPAHVSLARAFLRLDRKSEAKALLERAFELGPSLSEAYFVRGQLHLAKWNLPEAGRDFERAAMRSSSDSRVHDYYAYYLAISGRHEEARREMFRAADIDPISSAIFSDAGLFEYWAGRPLDAAAACEQALRVALPRYRPRAQRCLLHAYEAAGAWERARDHALAILESGDAALEVRKAVSGAGDPRVALTQYWQWAAQEENLPASQGSATAYARARAAAAMGDMERTLRSLEDALETRDPSLVQIRVEPRFGPIRDDARFRAVARAVGVPESY